MTVHGEPLGVLHLRAPEAGDAAHPLQLDKQLAGAIAEQVGLVLANLRLRENLRDQSIRDPLTGLYNRRFLDETLERELDTSRDPARRVGVLLLDIDHFKRLNDTLGHDAGDALLRELGNVLRGHVRGRDVACRFGGEEFLLILPEVSETALLARAEQLRAAVRAIGAPHASANAGISVSIGAAIFPDHASTPATLLRAADEALYRAKRGGRDRVELASARDERSVETGVGASLSA